MKGLSRTRSASARAFLLATVAVGFSVDVSAQSGTGDPRTFPAIGKVDPRFQSYNVETVEVVGGRFWAPYPRKDAAAGPVNKARSGGVDLAAEMFRKREPIDLGNRRLVNMAKALGPAYVRVSGAWANSTYFHDSDAPAPTTPPTGFQGVLTRAQWAGVVRFARATNSEIVASFPVSAGTRDGALNWNPDQARRMIRYTRQLGGRIAAAEMINEPNVGPLVGLPRGYTPANYAKDIAAFRALVAAEEPTMKIVGPGSNGEAGFVMFPKTPGTMTSEALMGAEPRPIFDVFSYHSYGTVSKRCAAMDKSAGTRPDDALTEAWLGRADTVFDYYKAIGDRYAPGEPIWVTEIAQTACGGDQWAATYLDTFRYIDHLGRLAKRGLQASFHNTLAASDYALIDDETLTPRPSYWAAVLWRRLMGDVVLDAGRTDGQVRVYSHCLPERRGGVGMVAINLDRAAPATLALARSGVRYTLTADTLQASRVRLNGRELALTATDSLPAMKGAAVRRGSVSLAPASITFLAVPGAGNAACR